MRLFISINLPEEFNRYLKELQGGLGGICGESGSGDLISARHVEFGGACDGGGTGLSKFDSKIDLSHAGRKSGFHLTLFFFGDVNLEIAKKIQDELKTVDFEPFTLRLSKKLNVFKGFDGGIRTIFVDIDPLSPGFPALLNLQKKVAAAVGKLGFKDDKKFVPHLTLSRVKFCPKNFYKKFESEILSIDVEQREFKVDVFYLMESRLGSGGSVYSEILKQPPIRI